MSVLFWPILMLPGFALVRRFFPNQLESGLLGMVSLSWLATCAILAPFAIIFYLFRAPVALFSGVIVVLVLLSLIEITRRRWWRELASLFRGEAWIGLIILIFECALSVRIGGFMLGDAQVHLARIRHLTDSGLNNYDPFAIPTTFPFPIYHTNLLHALYAAASQLTRVTHFEIWSASLPLAQILVASGSYYLAWTVFEDRRAGWVAAMFVMADRGPVNFVIYPNQVAPYWLWPMLMAFVIRATTENSPQRYGDHGEKRARGVDALSITGICAASLVMGMMHSLYAVFAGMVALPILFVAFVISFIRKSTQKWSLILCMFALAAGLPFALASKYMTPLADTANTALAFSTSPPPSGDYVHLENAGLVMRKLSSLPYIVGGSKTWSVVFVVGLICAAIGPARKRALNLAAFFLVALLILFVPQLCTPIYRAVGEEWVLVRFEVIFNLVFFALVPAAVGMLILRQIQSALHQALILNSLCVAAFVAGLFYATHESPWTWKEVIADARLPLPVQKENLKAYHDLQRFASTHLPRGSLVLIHPVTGIMLCAVHDVRIVASASGSNGVPNLSERMSDLVAMISPETSWDQRSRLLKKYDIRYFLPTAQTPADWAQGHVVDVQQSGGMTLLRLTY